MFDSIYCNRRVLVTGDTGFKGAWLCHWLLRQGARVSGVGLPPETTPNLYSILELDGRVRHHEVDIRDPVRLLGVLREEQPEVVFHLAAQALVRASYISPRETFEVNVGGVVNLLEAVRETPGVRSCVVVTSDKCYENQEWAWGYRECDPMGGHDPYSASKGAAEIVAASYRRSFFSEPGGTRLATARARQRHRWRGLVGGPHRGRPREEHPARQAARAAKPARRSALAARAGTALRVPAARRFDDGR